MIKVKRVFCLLALLCGMVVMTGCSGINYTHGVSPASFLLPGLVNSEDPTAEAEDVPEETAYVRLTQNL